MTVTTKVESPFQKEKLVMNINNDPGKIALVDRLNVYVVKTKRWKTKSDAIAHLLKFALDEMEKQEKAERQKIIEEKKEVKIRTVHD